jgi:glycosyltransferase involved in cell wall biosynthesis
VTTVSAASETRLDRYPSAQPLLLGSEWYADRPGGLNRYFAGLLDALSRCGALPKATVLGPATDAPAVVAAASSPTQTLPVRLWRYYCAAERNSAGATVVDAHFALYAFLPVVVGRLRDLPLVVHFQGPWADESVLAVGQASTVIGAKRLVERAVYRRATTAITLSTAFKQILVQRYGVTPWNVMVVPPGVDLEAFRPGDGKAARNRLGIPSGCPVIATVRRLQSRMGIDVLLDACARVRGDLPDAHLLIAGDGPERRRLENRAAVLGEGVTFLGKVDEQTLLALYRAADVTVVPTTSLEGFGLVLLESLACGTPVVVTDAGGLPEAVRELDPATVVPAGDSDALAAALLRCLTDSTATPSPESCRSHAEAHGWDRIATRHIDIYADAVSPCSPRPRLRVVFIDHCAELSGGELALLTVLPELRELEVHVILGEDGPLVPRLLRQGISVEILKMADVARDVPRHRVRPGLVSVGSMMATGTYVLRLALRLRRLQPDVVQTNSLKAALYGGFAARLAGLPVVWNIRDRIAADYLPPAAAHLVRAVARHVPHRIVANSHATLQTLGRAAVNGRVIASPIRSAAGSGRRWRNAPEEPLRVGMIGRLAPWKGQDIFLNAFAMAFPHGQHHGVIVGESLFGEDEYGESLITLARELGIDTRVEFRGFRDDVDGELARMDIAVHASILPEPFGRVVVEAMAAAVPVIAANAGGPAEIISAGVDGLLYPPGDIEALADGLRRLAHDPGLRERLRTAGRERARDFAPDRVASEFMVVYKDLMVARRAAP